MVGPDIIETAANEPGELQERLSARLERFGMCDMGCEPLEKSLHSTSHIVYVFVFGAFFADKEYSLDDRMGPLRSQRPLRQTTGVTSSGTGADETGQMSSEWRISRKSSSL